MFNFFANDDDAEFSLVDNKPAPRTRFGAKRFQQRGAFMRRDQTAFVGGDVGQGASRERARQQRMQSKKSQQWNTWAYNRCLLYTSPSPRDQRGSRMPSSA